MIRVVRLVVQQGVLGDCSSITLERQSLSIISHLGPMEIKVEYKELYTAVIG
jgi:hypothetical protein